jgi:hypothetical protein
LVEIGGMVSPHWRRGLRLQLISAAYWDGQTGVGVYADNDNGIHPRRPSSYRFQASENPSIESPTMSHNTAQPAWLLEKKLNTPIACFFLVKGLLLLVTWSVLLLICFIAKLF